MDNRVAQVASDVMASPGMCFHIVSGRSWEPKFLAGQAVLAAEEFCKVAEQRGASGLFFRTALNLYVQLVGQGVERQSSYFADQSGIAFDRAALLGQAVAARLDSETVEPADAVAGEEVEPVDAVAEEEVTPVDAVPEGGVAPVDAVPAEDVTTVDAEPVAEAGSKPTESLKPSLPDNVVDLLIANDMPTYADVRKRLADGTLTRINGIGDKLALRIAKEVG